MAVGGVDAVRIEGFRELRRELKKIDAGFPKAVRKMHKDIGEHIGEKAQGAARSQGSTLAHIAPSIKGGGTQSKGYVRFGGARYPMAAGAEFGSARYRQFKAWKGNGGDAGYAIFPTIRAEAPRIEDLAIEAVNDLIESI